MIGYSSGVNIVEEGYGALQGDLTLKEERGGGGLKAFWLGGASAWRALLISRKAELRRGPVDVYYKNVVDNLR